ncbi:E3 ubiquitin protein ligase RNF5-like protein [Tanacetum coccineum]
MDIFGLSPKSARPSYSENKSNDMGAFECNICFDIAQDPIVTLCGHLFCWPCLYKWLQFHSHSHECPVCKSLVEGDNLVPIYGRGTSNSNLRAHPLSIDEIPSRPASRRPPTAVSPNLTYFRQDSIVSPGNSNRNSLFGAISSFLNLQVHGLYETTDYREDSLLSPYGHGRAVLDSDDGEAVHGMMVKERPWWWRR